MSVAKVALPSSVVVSLALSSPNSFNWAFQTATCDCPWIVEPVRQRIESRIARRGVVDQVGPDRRIILEQAVIRTGGGAAAGSAVVDVDIDRDLVGDRRGQDRRRLLDAGAEACRRRHRRGIENEIDGKAAARRLGDDRTGPAGAILGDCSLGFD